MEKQIRNCYIALFSLLLLLSSCGKIPQDVEVDNCIPPIAKIEYLVGTPTPYPTNGDKKADIEPIGGWQYESTLPEIPKQNVPQIIASSNQIWILPLDSMKVYRYDSITQGWETYSTIDNYSAVPRKLVATKDGQIWGVGATTDNATLTPEFSLLSWYNENTDQFEFLKDANDVLHNTSPFLFPTSIAQDKNGLLWFFLTSNSDASLYSFNPSTRKLIKHLSLSQPDWVISSAIVIDSNNLLWFYNSGTQKRLFTYSPDTNRIEPYLKSPDFEEFGNVLYLYIDAEDRLWLNNQSWLDFSNPIDPEWHNLILPPEFLTDKGWFWYSHGEQVSFYGFEIPSQMFQSSNGWFWFTTLHGTIRLDPKNEKWCLFTTGSSPVIEDAHGNLWIEVFGKLYKYPVNK